MTASAEIEQLRRTLREVAADRDAWRQLAERAVGLLTDAGWPPVDIVLRASGLDAHGRSREA